MDLPRELITLLAWLGCAAIGHIIGYRRGKRFYEQKYKNCLMIEIGDWWEGWDE